MVLSVAPFVVALVPFALALATVPQVPQTQSEPVYEGKVQTALKAHCASCHTGESSKSGLDLSTFEGVMKGGDSGRAVVPGKADESLLIHRLEGKGGLDSMPLGFKQLSEEKIKSIRDWIDAGCKSSGKTVTHWAYVAPKLPLLPQVRLTQWPRNPIDNFVLSKIESKKLTPSPEANRETLVRRLYLDLTGLPPTPSEVDSYLKDTRPNAYENLVDRLLASPHFGERMARPWLDLARYADSDGYEKDLNRTAWKFRDWVINAFNQNLPYDRFTIEQIAGDMLPKARVEQIVATRFHRNAMFNSEGGVDPRQAEPATSRSRRG